MTRTVVGTNGDDIIYGSNSEADVLRGGLGDDFLGDKSGDSFAGTDKFFGGGGSDALRSLFGGAYMDGGLGTDTFFFKAGKTNDVGWNADIIWTLGDFLTIDNTDDGVSHYWIGDGHDELRIIVQHGGGVESVIAVHSDDGHDILLDAIDYT